jgi:hypothetical protein
MIFKDIMLTAPWSKRLRKSQASSGFYLEFVSVQRQSHGSRVISHQDWIGLGDYLDVSICGMAQVSASLLNYHQFEQLILDRHL